MGAARALLAAFAIPVAVGWFEALRSAWICDDVFISFRYVDHLVRGQGLVFNPGERVEGFTHFLWVMLLAALHRVGFDLVTLGRYLPLLFFAATLALLVRRSWTRRAPGWWGVPLAAWTFALQRDAQLHASSGLETSAFTLALLAGVLALAGPRSRVGLGGVLYALATLLRPEGALHTLVGGTYVLLRWRSPRALAGFAAPWLALVIPSEVFRVLYYGDWVPNTFYAKSAGASYWSQGWTYAKLYFRIYPVLLAGVAAVPGAFAWWWWTRRSAARDAAGAPPATREADVACLAGTQALIGTLYVVRVGGDFMFARFLVPVTPLFLVALEDVLRASRRHAVEVAAAILLVASMVAARGPRAATFPGRERVAGIVDEANYYTRDLVDTLRHQGEVLGRALRGTGARVGLLSGQDAVAYFGHLDYALEPHGLTDARLARQPLAARGRPGHEKGVGDIELIRRGIHFRLRYGFTVNLPMWRQIRFDDLYGEILWWDAPLMQRMRGRPGVNFLDFPTWLDGYIQNAGSLPPQRLLQDYVSFQFFYFAHQQDAARRTALRSALQARGISVRDLDAAEAHVVSQLRESQGRRGNG